MILAGTSLATYNAMYYATIMGIVALVIIVLLVVLIWFLREKAKHYSQQTREVQDLITDQSDVLADLVFDMEKVNKRGSYVELTGNDLINRIYSAHEMASKYERRRLSR